MKSIGLALAFVLEIVAFICFADIGGLIFKNAVVNTLIFVVLLVALMVFWGLYMAPKASKKLKTTPYYVAKGIIYAVAAFDIYATQNPGLAAVFAVAAIIDELLLYKHNLS